LITARLRLRRFTVEDGEALHCDPHETLPEILAEYAVTRAEWLARNRPESGAALP
jgi:hypothetical protein